jgi:glycosyltransferase involved in cell wall biosynthesis
VLVGLVARFAPQKDHRGFVRAAGIAGREFPGAVFVLVGKGAVWDNADLCGWIDEAGLRERFCLLGPRVDVPRVTAALDVAVMSSSHGEAFPTVVGEAMACGVPCVVTDVGDAGAIVGDCGWVVPPRDSDALAAGLAKCLALDARARGEQGMRARRRVEERFALPDVARRYHDLYLDVLEAA